MPDADRSDQTLLRRIRGGDQEAFRILFDRYVATLRARVRRWLPAEVRRKVSVSDVLQETRIAALDRCGGFEDRGEGAFRKWLLGIVDMKAREAIRRHLHTAKRAAAREVSHPQRPVTAQFASPEPSPSQAAIGRELEELARRAMETLREDDRRLLHLVREERLGFQEAAARTGRSYEAVKKAYGRALYRFTEAFERLRGGDDG